MKKILIVEDEEAIREFEAINLKRVGYTTVEAGSGEEALRIFDNEPDFDIALLDISMPGMDGFTLCKELRKRTETLGIIMLTARTQEMDKISGLMLGADDYITKPIDEEEMLYRIKALLRRAKIASDRKIVVGKVVLDYDALTVARGDEVHELPQKEFMLLYMLLSYPGKIFTRIQIMDEIWGADSNTGWETVTVHIARLRKRFEGWPEFEIISVRGLGYKAVKKQ